MKIAPLRLALVASSLAALTLACSAAPTTDPSNSTDQAMKQINGGDDTGGGATDPPSCPNWFTPPADLWNQGCRIGEWVPPSGNSGGYFAFQCPRGVTTESAYPGLFPVCDKLSPQWPYCPHQVVNKDLESGTQSWTDGCVTANRFDSVVWIYEINGSPGGCVGGCRPQ